MVGGGRCLLMAVVVCIGTRAARILGVFPSVSRSHVICYEALTTALAARGHQVTVISSMPQPQPLANYTDIAVPHTLFGLEELIKDVSGIQNYHMSIDVATHAVDLLIYSCQHYLENERVQQLIHSKDAHFDILIIEMEVSECFLGFAHKFPKAHLIGIYAQSLSPQILDIVGNPSPHAYIPCIQHPFTERMSFVQRWSNTISHMSLKFTRQLFFLPIQDYLMRKYFNDSGTPPYITEIQRKTALLLINNDVNLSFARPYLPNVIEVGGMHIKPPRRLPQALKQYLDQATEGVIYFSLGSMLSGLYMPKPQKKAFLEGFSTLKQRVIWISSQTNITGLPANVRLMKWAPQSDILAHPNVLVFLSHGGKLSLQEAAYHGVPMVGIPINADQFVNIQRVQDLGFGIQLEFSNVTTRSLQWALNELLYEPRYREKAKQLSARYRDQLMTPLERAVYWTEYIHRHNGAPHLKSAANNLAWYQYFMLDAIVLIALLASLLILVLYKAIIIVIIIVHSITRKCKTKVNDNHNNLGKKVE